MKRFAGFSIDADIYHKMHTIHMVRNIFFDDKKFTLSGLVETALKEYFENHKKEIDELMKTYHDKGGCADL